jgi:thymidylate kinase
MRIVLDGCDGTGKTTVAEKLANEFGCNVIRLTYGGDRSLKAYFQMMSCDNVVHDRSFISEIIYPKYFSRPSFLEPESEKYLWNMIKNLSINMFILTASSETIEKRIKQRGDEYIKDIDKFARINRDYIKYADEFDIPIINTTNCTVDEVIKKIGGYLV